MTTEIWLGIAGFMLALAGAFGKLAYNQGKLFEKVNNLSTALDGLTKRVDMVWEFIMRRGQSELVHKGWADMNSPLVLRGTSFETMLPFLKEFFPAYAGWLKADPKISDAKLIEKFEERFGQFIMEHICNPLGLDQGGCLSAIVLACKVADSPKKETANANG